VMKMLTVVSRVVTPRGLVGGYNHFTEKKTISCLSRVCIYTLKTKVYYNPDDQELRYTNECSSTF
jgi:hypothetical protein